MALFALIALILMGAGIVLGMAACLILAALLGFGILSVSFVVGMWTGRRVAGLCVLMGLCGIFGGLAGGMLCAWLTRSSGAPQGVGSEMIASGALGGAFGGVVAALTLEYLLRCLQRWASTLASRR